MLRTRGKRKIKLVIKVWNVCVCEAWEIRVSMARTLQRGREPRVRTPRKCDRIGSCEERHELFSGQ